MTAPLPPLARPSDVLASLGFEGDDTSVLPTTMQVRMDGTLARVSRRFRKEAERFFTPGSYTQTFKIQAGAVRLMEPPSSIEKVCVLGHALIDWRAWQEGGAQWVVWAEGEPGDEDFGTTGMLTVLGDDETPPPQARPTPHWTVNGIWMRWSDWDFWQMNGKRAEITYSWATPVPPDVVTAVADITARNLTVNPMGAERHSKLLMSRHFRQQVADWVMSGGVGFTKDDLDEARSYRYPIPPSIIASIDMVDSSPSQAFLSDTSW